MMAASPAIPRRLAWRLAGLLAFVVITAACEPVIPAPSTVGFVGDSITYSATEELAAVQPGRQHWVNAVIGINMTNGLALLTSMIADHNPEVVHIELGVNSLGDGWDAGDAAAMDAILRASQPVGCVVWTVPGALVPSYYDKTTTLRSRIAQLRQALTVQAQSYPNVSVADFQPVEDAHPDYVSSDGLHLTSAGQQAFAEFVWAQVNARCP